MSTSSTTQSSNNGTKRKRARTREQRQVEYERMKFRRNASTSGRSSISSLSSMTGSLLVNTFGSASSQSTMSSVTDDTYRRRRHEHDDQFQFDLIASQAPPSPQASQADSHPFQHSFDVFLQNFSFVNEDLQIQLDDPSMTPVDEVDDFPIKDCFALLDLGVLPTKPLHMNKEMQKLQEKFLKDVYKKNGGMHEGGMVHCLICFERWFDTKRSHVTTREPYRGYLCKDCSTDERRKAMYSAMNDMDPWKYYEHLKLPKLNDIGEMSIALIQPYMRIFYGKGKLCLSFLILFPKLFLILIYLKYYRWLNWISRRYHQC